MPAVATPDTSQAVALFGEPVSSLSAQITLLGAFNEEPDADIGLDRIHLAQHRVLGALPLVGFLVASVGEAISVVGVPVTPIGLPVTSIGLPVTPIGLPVTLVSRQVPLPAGITDVGGVVALAGSPVPCIAGLLSLRRGMDAQVRSPLAPPCGLLTFLRCQRAVECPLQFLPGEGAPQILGPLCRDPVTLVGDVTALVSDPVTLVGNAVALSSDPVTLVGAALAFALGLGSHRASLQ